MKKSFLILVSSVLVALVCTADETVPKKYYYDNVSSIMSFILLNHSRLMHDINYGNGEYVESLINQKNNKLNIDQLKLMLSSTSDPYQFAKIIAEY